MQLGLCCRHSAKGKAGGFCAGKKGRSALWRGNIGHMQGQHKFVPAAAGLLHNAFYLGAHCLTLAHLGTGHIHGVLELVHVLAGAFFFKALFALVLKQHFSGFKGNKIHALHASRSAKLAGLFVQLCHMGGTGIAPAEQLGLFQLAAFVFCSAVRHAARQKAHAAE